MLYEWGNGTSDTPALFDWHYCGWTWVTFNLFQGHCILWYPGNYSINYWFTYKWIGNHTWAIVAMCYGNSVCLSVCPSHYWSVSTQNCQNGWTDRASFGNGATLGLPCMGFDLLKNTGTLPFFRLFVTPHGFVNPVRRCKLLMTLLWAFNWLTDEDRNDTTISL